MIQKLIKKIQAKKDTSPIVCNCMQVTENQVIESLKNGASNVKEVQETTSLGWGCGSCITRTVEMIEEYKKED